MDLTWNLDNIYTSFSCERFKKDMEQLNIYIASINKLDIRNWKEDESSSSKIEEFLKLNNEYKKIYSKLSSYLYLIVNMDFENIEAMNISDDIEYKNLELTKVFVTFSRWLSNITNLDEIISTSPYILEHKFYLLELLRKSKYLLNEKEELIFAKMQISGSRAWQKLYMETISTATVDITIDDVEEKVTLTELRNMAYEKDTSLRKAAYYAENDLCKNISQICAKCINSIGGEALNIYELRGYKSPLEKVLLQSRMDFETLNAMTMAIKESLPMFHKYFYKKAKLLGHKDNLPFYDVYAPVGDNNVKISYDDAKNLIIYSFKNFSEQLAYFARNAFENRWIDAEPRKNKGNYGLSVDIFPMKESRIMTSFNGKYIDVSIIAHEIGHAYHSSKLYNEEMLNTEYPIPIAETASIFCETIVINELLNILPSNQSIEVLERSISDAAYYIVDFYGRYIFENKFFEQRELGALSVEELNKLMINSMKASYGNSIKEETIHPYMWMNKVGYFMAGNEYLNFPYFFGILFSKGIYAEYIKEKKNFEKKYNIFLSQTSKNNIVDIAKVMDIDVHSIDFWRNALKIIEKDIEKFIEL